MHAPVLLNKCVGSLPHKPPMLSYSFVYSGVPSLAVDSADLLSGVTRSESFNRHDVGIEPPAHHGVFNPWSNQHHMEALIQQAATAHGNCMHNQQVNVYTKHVMRYNTQCESNNICARIYITQACKTHS